MTSFLPAARSKTAWILAVVAVGGLAGCGAGAALPGPADATWAGERWPGTTLGDLESGRSTFVSRCGNCHAQPEPAQKAPEEWDAIVAKMARRARLTDDEKVNVTHYLTTMSARGRTPAPPVPAAPAEHAAPMSGG